MILVVALLVFGPKRVPELARTLGRGLSEFRRASNDLRQSLALDDLQHDLSKDLNPKQTIHKPEDRPSQAGDDVATPKSAAASQPEVGGEANPSKHPGELPLGNDHEHRDVPADNATDDATDDAAESAAESADGTNSDISDAGTDTDRNTNRAADSELGNVPVSDSKPTDPQRG